MYLHVKNVMTSASFKMFFSRLANEQANAAENLSRHHINGKNEVNNLSTTTQNTSWQNFQLILQLVQKLLQVETRE